MSDDINDIKQILSGFQKSFLHFNQKFCKIVNDISIQYSPVFKQLNLYNEAFINAFKAVQQIANNFCISEDRKKELEKIAREWGELGWTMPPSAPLFIFRNPPVNTALATRKMLSFCKKEDMIYIFNEILNHSKNKEDVNEAIFLFNNKKYKSCILILFSLIDGIIINSQKKRKNKKGKVVYRDFGKKGLEKFIEENKINCNEEKLFFFIQMYSSLQTCLEKIFENGFDFRRQPSGINRNFVAHGMLRRNVIRKDCVQVFLLYYNLMTFIERYR